MMLRILLNVLPCSGFMKKSAIMFFVRQKATLTLPFFILSAMKKYHMLICQVLFELEDFHSLLVDLYLCCLGILLLLVRGVLVQIENAMSTVLGPSHHPQPLILPLLSFSYWVFVYMMWCTWLLFWVSCISLCLLFTSRCTAYELSTHHFASLSGSIVSVVTFVFLMYCITFVSFFDHWCLALLL